MHAEAILVTGGAGYIGSHTVIALLDQGHPVVVVDNLTTGLRSAVDQRAVFIHGNVSDTSLVRSAIHNYDIKAIIHFAGSIIVPESLENPIKYYTNNSAASLILINTAVETGISRFVFSSTAAVYGNSDRPLVSEKDLVQPANPYGTSKLITELMLRDVALAHPFNYIALRYFNVAGADPHLRTGQSTKEATHLIKVALEAATGKRPYVGVFGSDYDTIDGTGVRDYIHVSDLAAAHVQAISLLLRKPENHVLNCGYGTGYSVLQVLAAVEKVTGCKITKRFESRRPGDPASLIADNAQLVSALNWHPKYNDLEQMISDAHRWENRLITRRTNNALPRDP